MDGSPKIPTGSFAGRYSVERELGRGATATVYLARDRESDSAVAIKVLRPELAASVGAERFLREIRVNEQLKHPNIAPVLDSGEHEGQLFFVLPHMEGGSLRHLLRREKQLPLDQAVSIALSIAEALEYAHGQGLIHRDVKPENILFSAGTACLADFGIAKAIERTIDESTTSTGLVRGTPAYMSPEQASGSKDYDGRSDQYSLACVLYEMIAGMPAFIGPTAEAIIAQRFQHAPRKLHVYRSSVSPGLEAVIERALALVPADRFVTTAAFGHALRDAPRQPTTELPVAPPWRVSRLVTVGAIAAIAIAAIAVTSLLGTSRDDVVVADTSKYLVLPVDSSRAAGAGDLSDLLHQAFTGWSGIQVVDRFVARALLESSASPFSDSTVQGALRKTAAGRYVRTDLVSHGTELRATAALFDAGHQRLSEASVVLRLPIRGGGDAFAGLVRSLLLRGDTTAASSNSVPALQAYLSGWTALRQLDNAAAESSFAHAVELDGSFDQAALWLAQARAWRSDFSASWRGFAEKAAANATLSPRDRLAAEGLLALSDNKFTSACRAYEQMKQRNARDFVAWFGLGECQRRDVAVVRDSHSPSGWRFRSNYAAAARAYARGFELAPSVARDIAPGSYARLQHLLFADRSRVLRGQALPPDTGAFIAPAVWEGDSLAFIPYPAWKVQRGLPTANTARRLRALGAQRREFDRIARSWSAMLGSSAGAKEAVAVSLESAGDPKAVDTMRLARRLAPAGKQQLRFAIEEVLLGAALARREPTRLDGVVRLADSLLSAPPGDAESARMLAPVAALLGRCNAAAALAAKGASPQLASRSAVPHFVFAAIESLSVRAALGCAGPSETSEIQRLLDAAVAAADPASHLKRDQLEYSLLSQAASLVQPLDSAQLGRLSRTSGDYILSEQLLALRGDSAAVASALGNRLRTRGDIGAAQISFDAALVEARMLTQIGDTVLAMRWLAPVLSRTGWLDQLWEEPLQAAALVHAAALYAALAHARRDAPLAAAWTQYVTTLWRTADKDLRTLLRTDAHSQP